MFAALMAGACNLCCTVMERRQECLIDETIIPVFINSKGFEHRSHITSRWTVIIRISLVLNILLTVTDVLTTLTAAIISLTEKSTTQVKVIISLTLTKTTVQV